MKKIFFLTFSCLALLSCSSDDESSNSGTSLTGTWKLTAFTTDTAVDFNLDGVTSTNYITESGCYDNSTMVLAANNVATVTLQEADIDFVFDFENPENSTFEFICNDGTAQAGTWSQNNNNVTVTVDDEPVVFTLNGNTLTAVLEDFVETEVDNGGEVIVEFTGATLVFTKQ
uniref:lipocalin family protein n=1 Tax=Flavobacterium sp. TaxID=239 RepID=UPI004049AADA